MEDTFILSSFLSLSSYLSLSFLMYTCFQFLLSILVGQAKQRYVEGGGPRMGWGGVSKKGNGRGGLRCVLRGVLKRSVEKG